MSEKFHIPALPLLPIVKVSAVAVGALGVIGWVGMLLWGSVSEIGTMLAGLTVAWLAAMAALLPLKWANRAPDDRLIGGCMLMMSVRMLLTFVGSAGLVLGGASLHVVVGWVLAAYLVLLGVEVVTMVRSMPAGNERAIFSEEPAA